MKNPLKLPLSSIIFSTASILMASSVLANNAVLRSIFSCQAQGLGGAIPTIKVWYQQGTNLSFIPAEETIKKVWLDDPSQVTLDFDGPMCVQFGQDVDNGDCEDSAASVIHMRRIQKLDIPGLPHTDNTLLTVITEADQKKRLYTFRVLYQEGSPEYNTLAVFPDPPNSGVRPCVRVEE
ncbi:MAG: hypothetical protein MJK14_08110 [Rivularia sp. ALOHA_DT_140]|nr:hypothetical protein [Rivularia sp. ALOHA_DT_140]